MSLERALSLLDEAAFQRELWPVALEAVQAALQARICSLFVWTPDGIDAIAPDSAQTAYEAYVSGGWGALDLRTNRAPHAPDFAILTEATLVTPEEHASAEFYRGFATEFDVPHFAGLQFSSGDARFGFTAMRSAEVGPLVAGDAPTMQRIATAVSSAALISSKLEAVRTRGAIEGFEAANMAVIALARDGRVIDLTRKAQAMLCPAFDVREGSLASTDRRVAMRLAGMMRGLQAADHPLESFAYDSACGARVLVIPQRMAGAGFDVFRGVSALLFLKAPASQPQSRIAVLRQVYAMTEGEAQIACAIAQGLAPAEIAHARGVSVHTVRHMLKAVYAKIGVRKASELAALVSQL